MKHLKLRLIQLADWIDDHLIRHRFYRLCNLIGTSPWWDVDVNDDAHLLLQEFES